MKLEYRYGQAYWTDLHPGDIIPDGCGNYKTLTEEDIDEYGRLKINNTVSSTSTPKDDWMEETRRKIEEETDPKLLYSLKVLLGLYALSEEFKKEGSTNE